ncbi:hypothetical protein CTAM01_12572 [Colletotrichum tamarilloi]|uniref:Uncharacterized protein n=1 Tax=Colletotrichum tamarilloi TaxID=1209934 RepID=A0ABQ9QUJ7_9PEZI|nr:uncharacterized protein CTAM01_12572 [Colletotrichum tamarilloi]KAI3539848.1 hypothetical protein CSPX01_08555 [Colletotrichum filicis]KAK1485357.1 hypothetical protein CTAM01_12572 [Colletotrichum tamarilloi]
MSSLRVEVRAISSSLNPKSTRLDPIKRSPLTRTIQLLRRRMRDDTVSKEALQARQDSENENEPDEKDDDCDDDDDEKKCTRTRNGQHSTATATQTQAQPSATTTSLPSSAPAPPSSTTNVPSSSPFPLPPLPPQPSTLVTSTLSVVLSSTTIPPVTDASTSSTPLAAETSTLSSSVIPLPSSSSPTTSSSVAGAPVTTASPPPTQASTSSNNAGRTTGIVFLILGFFLFRRWRSRRQARRNEKTKSVMGEPPAPPRPDRPDRFEGPGLPPLTSNPPMVSLPPPPPIQRSLGQPPPRSSGLRDSSTSSRYAIGTGPSPQTQQSLDQSASVITDAVPAPREEKPQANYAIPAFFQSAIERRQRNAAMAQARVESWPPPPYIGRKEPRTTSLRGMMSRFSRPSNAPTLSPMSSTEQQTFSTVSQESLIIPWRSSTSSSNSSLSSGWGDGPPIPTPVLVAEKPLIGRKIYMTVVNRGSEVAPIQEMPRQVV